VSKKETKKGRNC